MRLRLLLSFCCLISLPSIAQSRVDCDAIRSQILNQPVHYCVLLPPGYDTSSKRTYPVLYYLHGLGENEQTLFQTGGWNLIDDLHRQSKIGDFLIATPEAKASFYVNSADGRVRYGDFFLREFILRIEGKYHVRRELAARAISGVSMGGYGALRFAFAYPDMFSAVSAQSAALMTATPQELTAAIRAGSPVVTLLGPVFGNPIDVAHWNANSPFVLAQRNKAAIKHLAIYFNCGREDGFQFDTGAKALDRQLQAEGIKHDFHLYPGDHSAAYFL